MCYYAKYKNLPVYILYITNINTMPKIKKGLAVAGITSGILFPHDANMNEIVGETPSYIEFPLEDSRGDSTITKVAGSPPVTIGNS